MEKFGRLPKIDAGSTPAQPRDAPLVGCVAALASGGAEDFFQSTFETLTAPLSAQRISLCQITN